ncbi:hypothetical protein AB0L63_23625 [Nocardia sp. NPDC051990]|uniref:hypothetical protein n=1 Tax=Nocardia sp. NPDC051990 TaxID=3155285 RepID=UPI00342C20BA
MAFPLYPELKSKVEKMLLKFFEQKAREELGPLRDVRRFSVHEGRKLVHNTLDNQEDRGHMAYEVGSVEFAISHEEMAEMTVDDVRALLEEKAKEFGAQQAQQSYMALDRVTTETGNVIDAGGKPLTVDLFLETISKISLTFDKFGNPQMPTIVIHPSMAEKYRALIEEANNDEDIERRLNEILAQKKGEYDAEQARRKLVD